MNTCFSFAVDWFVTNELPTEYTIPIYTTIFELQNITDSGLLVANQQRQKNN